MSTIIILGGHGKVALHAHRKLVEAGHSVTATIRSAHQAAAIEKAGASPLVLDLQEASTDQLAEAISGHDAVVWSAGAGGPRSSPSLPIATPRSVRWMRPSARAFSGTSWCRTRSSLDHGVAEDHGFFPYVQAKAEADVHLRESSLDWTILGPGFLTDDDPAGTVGPGPIEEFGGDRQGPGPQGERTISRSDVAQTIVDALDIASTVGRTIEYGRGTPIREALAR